MTEDGGTRLTVVDSHTCGQPTRVILDGLPELRAESADQARELLRREHDHIRQVAVFEPRGYPSLMAVAVLPPAAVGDAWKAVFMDAAGYPDMCGHATIGVATTLVETGLVTADSADTALTLDTPGGVVSFRMCVVDGHVESVTLINRPAYYLETVTVDGPRGQMTVPIAYGGQWYAFADATAFGLSVEPKCVPDLLAVTDSVRVAVARQLTRPDPRTGEPPCVENVMWVDDPRAPGIDGRNMPVNRAGAFDRSPCGTGTSARLAVLHAAAQLAVGEDYVNSGVIGTVYRARIAATTTVAETVAVVPEITGSAWLTGRSELWVDPTDPVAAGFLL